ncbi:protein MpPMT.5 [Marchantia polymorpha subsp. ruderalis]|uniref:Methyltransferase n=3 Tax=Marchantia polymorpha TaxID=3197 RepID=A0AAF6BMI8_MARPO|nr:hypothetical protein MARPO_0052s0026 [Marchantia polymorpha]BBN13222.1 hypothetical protein Mp_6g01780 [Marchantia polymorpha subsp. ruderalis]|eukprot:PTQ38223.1 hypothetical protein MARPO_0052s0026 [Marchantia polymorpha]
MLGKTTPNRMRGSRNNDAVHKRRVFVTVCATVLMLSLLSIYYSSFFNSRMHHVHGDGSSEEEREWEGASKVVRRPKPLADDLSMDDTGADKGEADLDVDTINLKEERPDETKRKADKYEADDDKDDSDERTDNDDQDASAEDPKDEEGIDEVTLKTFPVCDSRYSELIPCLDQSLQKQLKMRLNHSLMEHFERHCPPPQQRLNCLIPPPPNYQVPVKWPESRDEVWQANIPHTFLATNKSDQHWMELQGDKAIFPGGGTHFHDGADKYIANLGKMLGEADGDLSKAGKIRTVFDVGCGVASFGAFLLPLDIIAMSLAPNDVHQNQIQFALERGIPSMLGVLGTMRLPYPSKSFDLAHCSRCRIDWHKRDGILLLEVDRLLRPGGYFAWSSPAAYRETESDRQEWNEMTTLVRNMCWTEAAKEGQTVIWQKPLTSECYEERLPGTHPPLCSSVEDPDAAWGLPMKTCITPLTKYNEDSLEPWPQRLTAPSPRLQELGIAERTFETDTFVWQQRVQYYWKQLKINGQIAHNGVRNIMDMNANFGGFAAALKEQDVWIMNVVSPYGPNTLKMVYDRGLIGTLHDWCEAFSTYPRTYDVLHAWDVFSKVDERGCSIEDLLLEMDRVVRPWGIIIIRDNASMVNRVGKYLKGLRWDHWSKDDFEIVEDALSHGDEKILMARKRLWQPVESF